MLRGVDIQSTTTANRRKIGDCKREKLNKTL
jgi:hypothetical protein